MNRPKKDLKADAILMRKDRVWELTSQGYSQRQIASMLKVSDTTVAHDQIFLRNKAKENIKTYVNERLPEEYEKCLVGITTILREAWTTSNRPGIETKEKLSALSLAKECYSMKLDLLTNATVVKDAMKFVSEHTQNQKIDKDSNLLHTTASSATSNDVAATRKTTNEVF